MGVDWKSLLVGISALSFICYLFFDRLWLIVLVWPLLFVYLKETKKNKKERIRRKQLLLFRQWLESLVVAMTSGKSMENACAQAYDELCLLSEGRQSDWLDRLHAMQSAIHNGVPVEHAFHRFADHFDLTDIDRFAEMITNVKRQSGTMIDVTRRAAQMIAEKIEVEQEIAVLIAGKKMELTLLFASPLVFLAILKWTSADYMRALYQTNLGIVIMSVALLVLIGAFYMTKKWTRIEL